MAAKILLVIAESGLCLTNLVGLVGTTAPDSVLRSSQ